jgi:hypothetical protein
MKSPAPFSPVVAWALAVKAQNYAIRPLFARALFGADIHPALAELVWWTRYHRDSKKGGSDHECDLAAVTAAAITHNDSEFFRQLARCMDRFPAGTVRDFPIRALVLLAYGYCETPDPTPAEVTRQANSMTDRHLEVSRVVKELVALGLHAGAKN